MGKKETPFRNFFQANGYIISSCSKSNKKQIFLDKSKIEKAPIPVTFNVVPENTNKSRLQYTTIVLTIKGMYHGVHSVILVGLSSAELVSVFILFVLCRIGCCSSGRRSKKLVWSVIDF